MGYRVLIPTPLRPYTGQQDAVEAEGVTVGEVLAALTNRYTDLRRHLYADDGTLRHFVNVYVNDDDIRYLERDATPLKPGDVISIIPSVAGGAPVSATSAPPELTNAEVQRYSRDLILPEVGPDGQRRLKAGRVVCVGRAVSVLRPPCISRRLASAPSASSISMGSTPATSSGRSCTARRTSAGRSCSRRGIGCRRSTRK